MKTYTFDKNKNYLFFAPHNWGKTMGIVIPQANNNDDVLLFANLTETQESLLNPFVTYLRGCMLSDNQKKAEEFLSLAKTCPFSRIIVDDTAKLLDINTLTTLLEISETRNIPILLTFQTKEQAQALGINTSAFSVFDLEQPGITEFTENDFGFFYADNNQSKTELAESNQGNIAYVKKKANPADLITVDFDSFMSQVAAYTILNPELVISILENCVVPNASIKTSDYNG